MEVTTIQKHIHTSPRKLKLVADMIRRMKPVAAVRSLKFTNKSAATPLAKAIETVLANAKQQNLVAEELTFAKIEINEGPAGRRFRAGTRGRAKPYKKRTSHIKIVLTDEVKTSPVDEVKENSLLKQKEVGQADLAVKTAKSEEGLSKTA